MPIKTLAAVLLLSIGLQPAYASEWYVWPNISHDQTYTFVDKESIARTTTAVTLWQRTEKVGKAADGYYLVSRVNYHCVSRTLQTLEMHTFKDGKPVMSYPPQDPQTAIPDSYGEIQLKEACHKDFLQSPEWRNWRVTGPLDKFIAQLK